jgi:hypothetical protein
MAESRRVLRFDSLEDAVKDADYLLVAGYRQLGKWSLGQSLTHLTQWLTFPVDGFPDQPLLARGVLWIARHTVGKRLLNKILRTGEMELGSPTMPITVPKPGIDDREAFQGFVRAVNRFVEHQGDYFPSPLFGSLTHEQANQLQCIHCQHHLSFLIPADQTMSWTGTAAKF